MIGSSLHILSVYIPLFCYAFKVTIDYSCHPSVFCAIGGRVICQMAVMQTSVSNISNWSYLWNSHSAAEEIWHFYITHLSKVNFSIPIFLPTVVMVWLVPWVVCLWHWHIMAEHRRIELVFATEDSYFMLHGGLDLITEWKTSISGRSRGSLGSSVYKSAVYNAMLPKYCFSFFQSAS